MKALRTHVHKMKFSTCIKSVASLLVLGGFIWLVAGSAFLGAPLIDTKMLPDSTYEETESYFEPEFDIQSVITGKRDKFGYWEGNVEIKDYKKYPGSPRTLKGSASGPFVDGLKQGNWTIIKHWEFQPFTTYEYIRFNHGIVVGHWKRNSTADSIRTAFEILQYGNSIFLNKLMLFDWTDLEIQTYTDSLEAILGRREFDSARFDNNYSNARYELENDPHFDSISKLISSLVYPEGLYRLKRNELRLAVLQRNRNGSGTTYASVTSTYPGYLAYMNAHLVTNPEFDGFCQELDSTMDSYGPLNRDDAFFIDSVDARLYRAMSAMGSKSPSFGPLLALQTNAKTLNINAIRNEADKIFKRLKDLKTSRAAVWNLCYADFSRQYDEADIMKAAVREACFLKRQWAQLPVLTTDYSGSNSMTSVTIRGNIIESAGAEVTSRGIAWADTYNPTLDSHVVASGSGLGTFQVSIEGLEPDKTYYARSFATNRAGTAYGNIIEFTTARVSSSDIPARHSLTLSVYPNPASQTTTLNYSAELPGYYLITILNLNGQTVYNREIRHPEPGVYHTSIDLSSIPGGIYCCRVSNGTSTSICKLLKAK